MDTQDRQGLRILVMLEHVCGILGIQAALVLTGVINIPTMSNINTASLIPIPTLLTCQLLSSAFDSAWSHGQKNVDI